MHSRSLKKLLVVVTFIFSFKNTTVKVNIYTNLIFEHFYFIKLLLCAIFK